VRPFSLEGAVVEQLVVGLVTVENRFWGRFDASGYEQFVGSN